MRTLYYVALGGFIAFITSVRFAGSWTSVAAICIGVAAVLALSAVATRPRA